jgi:hypothetical protein
MLIKAKRAFRSNRLFRLSKRTKWLNKPFKYKNPWVKKIPVK